MAEITTYPLKLVKGLRVYQGTLTSDYQGVDLTATWNAGATTFTLLKANVTNTASAAASKLIDLQVGGVTQFNVTRAGVVTTAGAINGVTISSGAVSGVTTLVTTGQISSTANGSGATPNVLLGGYAAAAGARLIGFGTGSTKTNWIVGSQFHVDNGWEVCPSTASGGSTFTNPALAVDDSATATHTRLLVWDVDNATLERVSVGAADSGGAGFKLLRIPN